MDTTSFVEDIFIFFIQAAVGSKRFIKRFLSFSILNLCNHPSQLPIRAFMPWQLVIDSTVFNVSCY